MTTLAIVIPCFNEEEVLPETKSRLVALVEQLVRDKKINKDSKIYFVDDVSGTYL